MGNLGNSIAACVLRRNREENKAMKIGMLDFCDHEQDQPERFPNGHTYHKAYMVGRRVIQYRLQGAIKQAFKDSTSTNIGEFLRQEKSRVMGELKEDGLIMADLCDFVNEHDDSGRVPK